MTRGRNANTVRIIGGQWRSRRLPFPDAPGLRPTPDRVRETLFNWLQYDIHGARCLDLYAGSGALGFEALSRGAARAVLVEQNAHVARQLAQSAQLLKTSDAHIINSDAISYLKRDDASFDIVFIDPPFALNAWPAVIDALAASHCLAANALIYIESPANAAPLITPADWTLAKRGTAGDVQYTLYRIAEQSEGQPHERTRQP